MLPPCCAFPATQLSRGAPANYPACNLRGLGPLYFLNLLGRLEQPNIWIKRPKYISSFCFTSSTSASLLQISSYFTTLKTDPNPKKHLTLTPRFQGCLRRPPPAAFGWNPAAPRWKRVKNRTCKQVAPVDPSTHQLEPVEENTVALQLPRNTS